MSTPGRILLTIGLILAGCTSTKKTQPNPPTSADRPEPPKDTSPTPSSKPEPKPSDPKTEEVKWGKKPMKEWFAAIEGKDLELRNEAARDGGFIGARVPGVVPALAKALDDEHPLVRTNAAKSLLKIGADAGEAVPALGKVLKRGKERAREEGEMRLLAVKTLVQLGPKAKPAQAELLYALKEDKDKQVRQQAALALGRLGSSDQEVLDGLIQAFRDPDKDVAAEARNAMVRIGTPAASPLIKALESRDRILAPHAALALGDIKPASKEAIDSLTRGLTHLDPEICSCSALGISYIGPEARSAGPQLTRLLNNNEPRVTSAAAAALEKIKPDADLVPELMKVLKAETSPGRKQAANVLIKIGRPAVKELVEALRSTIEDVPQQAAYALGKIGPVVKEEDARALQRLTFLLNDDGVHDDAFRALQQIVPNASVVPELVKIVQNDQAPGRKQAVELLGMMGQDAKAAAEALVPLLKSEDGALKRAAGAALLRVDPETAAKHGLK